MGRRRSGMKHRALTAAILVLATEIEHLRSAAEQGDAAGFWRQAPTQRGKSC